MPLLKTLVFTLLVPGTVAGLVPWLLARDAAGRLPAPRGLQWLGLQPMALGAAVYLRCAWDFATRGRGTPSPTDPPRALVASGLYRWSRNPMYVGVVAVIAGWAALFGSFAVLAYALVVLLMFHLRVVLYEEPVLRRGFGDEYERYRRRVPRWIGRPARE